jgi:hypothetical protein
MNKWITHIAILISATVFPVCASILQQDFNADPAWVEYQNRSNNNNFGFSNTDYTVGLSHAGEAGGIWGASGGGAYYGDVFGSALTFGDAFASSGELIYLTSSTDANRNVQVGYFSEDPSSSAFIGFALLESCGSGCYTPGIGRAQAQITFSDGSYVRGNQFSLPLNTPLTWAFFYDPNGNGTLSFTLDTIGTSIIMLSPSQRATGLYVNSFGLSDSGGLGTVEAYFDRLTYEHPIPEPSMIALCLVGLISLGLARGKDQETIIENNAGI